MKKKFALLLPGIAASLLFQAVPVSAGSGGDISFEGLTAVDNEACAITITDIDSDNMWGYTLNALMENRSADTTYMFSVESASINGVQADPLFADEIAPGKKANEEISFPDLEDYGITDFTDIELVFRVYDSNNWMADDVARETVHVYPYGEENAIRFVREPQDTDRVLVENDIASVIITDIEEDDIWGYTLNLFIENKTAADIMVSVDEASVNGFMIDPFFATQVNAGKCEFTSVSWSDSSLEENGITDVQEIELLLRAYDYEDWTAGDYINERFVINP